MTQIGLPPEILAKILRELLRSSRLSQCLKLRLVSKLFEHEVSHVLFEQGEVDRRFFRTAIKCKSIHQNFSLKYWRAFLHHAVGESQKTPDRRNDATAQDAADPQSDALEWSSGGSTPSTSRPAGLRTRRRTRLRDTLAAAVLMYLSTMDPTTMLQDGRHTHSTKLEKCCDLIAHAAVLLMGGRDSLLFLSRKRNEVHLMSDKGRHLERKPPEIWVLITAIYQKDLNLAMRYLDYFRLTHSRLEPWLERLSAKWEGFVWNSSRKERMWLEALAACLIMAAKGGEFAFFELLLDAEPGIFTYAFTFIEFEGRNVVRNVISTGQFRPFYALIDRGWPFFPENENVDYRGFGYRQALFEASDVPKSAPGRFDILRCFLIMSNHWQDYFFLSRLLYDAAIMNDVEVGELIVHLLRQDRSRSKPDLGDRLWATVAHYSCPDVLVAAARGSNLEMVRFLMKNRAFLYRACRGCEAIISPQSAVSGLMLRREPVPTDCLAEILSSSETGCHAESFVRACKYLSCETVAVFAHNINCQDKCVGEYHLETGDLKVTRSASPTSSVSVAADAEDPPISTSSLPAPLVLPPAFPHSATPPSAGVWQTGEVPARQIPPPTSRLPPSAPKSEVLPVSIQSTDAVGTESEDDLPSIGERGLVGALTNLRVDTARILIEKFGVRISWGSVNARQVWDTEEKDMEALAELQKLLAEYGMFMETKLIYATSFHPAAGSSSDKWGYYTAHSPHFPMSRESSRITGDVSPVQLYDSE